FFKQKAAYEIFTCLEFRRVLFRSLAGVEAGRAGAVVRGHHDTRPLARREQGHDRGRGVAQARAHILGEGAQDVAGRALRDADDSLHAAEVLGAVGQRRRRLEGLLLLELSQALLGLREARHELLDAPDELARLGLEARAELAHDGALGREVLERIGAHQSLDAARTRAHGAFARHRQQADLRRRADVRARAQLTRERSADLHDAHALAVLLAEERHGAQRLRLVEAHDRRLDGEVVADGAVGDLLDLAAGARADALRPREVQAHVSGLVVRAGLVRA